MNLKSIVASEKQNIRTGSWQSGHIPRTAWPSRKAKAKAYKWGPNYSWRIMEFQSGDINCRIRILLNEQKQIFKAALGVSENGETIMLCEYEYHASEPGWHCHARCNDISELDAGKTRFGGMRFPRPGKFHRKKEFVFKNQPITRVTALNCAMEFFNLTTQGELL